MGSDGFQWGSLNQWVPQRNIAPVSIYFSGLWCYTLYHGMVFQCGSTIDSQNATATSMYRCSMSLLKLPSMIVFRRDEAILIHNLFSLFLEFLMFLSFSATYCTPTLAQELKENSAAVIVAAVLASVIVLIVIVYFIYKNRARHVYKSFF